MRKLAAYGLLFLFTWQLVGFVGYFEISHYRLKKEIKSRLKKGVPQNELVIFEYDRSEMEKLVWLKKNEFDNNGNLFDVVRRKEKGRGITYLECISDVQEKILFANLGQRISNKIGDDQHPTPVSNWIKILNSPSICEFHTLEITTDEFLITKDTQFLYMALMSSKSIRIDCPPPKNLVYKSFKA